MFNELNLNKGLQTSLNNLGFDQPTDVQAQAVPLAIANKDLLVSAQTGSGKTVAFLLPTIHRLLTVAEVEGAGTRVLILTPTRELARQIFKQSKLLTSNTNIDTGLIIGGDEFKFQKAIFRKNPEIIIATPGRLVEHLEKGSPDFKELEVLILDEADRMLDMGFNDDMLFINKFCKAERQTMLFSATLNNTGMNSIAKTMLNQPVTISLNAKREQNEDIQQQVILADDKDHKQKQLAWLLENQDFNKAVVFTNTRLAADRLCGFIRYKRMNAYALHGEISQTQRKKIMEQFRENKFDILIASDVAARGLDIKGIDLVINFDMPRNGDDYTHRIGRTGRAGEKGLAISLVMSSEWNVMSSIERYLKTVFEHRTIKELKANFTGPKKLKNSGKAAGKKKKPKDAKAKVRNRPKKDTSKRRPTTKPMADRDASGLSTLKRKPKEQE
ncbi:MAG: ATP-dependent RNA helicase SrmB [Pseudomonadales bacterium]